MNRQFILNTLGPESMEEINTDNILFHLEINQSQEDLRSYNETKLDIADQLRTVRESLKTLGRDEAEQECTELIEKLAEDRFILAVLGQFKRGKSSLMNAIISEDLLPTGVLPLTSAITILKYGPVKRLIVNREGFFYPKELPVTSLPDYVTQNGNPDNEKKVKNVAIELPVSFLRSGIEFVDTPGVGSAISANTATTYDFLPECDAVLFVTSVDTPMTSVELDFLKEIKQYVHRIFFVVNKIDLVTESERNEVLKFVTNTIRKQIETEDVKVYPISSRLALEAQNTGNKNLYEKSELNSLENALAAFLSTEKSAAFLSAVTQKLIRIINREVAAGTVENNYVANRIQEIQKEKIISIHQDPHDAASAILTAQKKLSALQQSFEQGQTHKAVKAETSFEVIEKDKAENELTSAQIEIQSISDKDMQAGLQESGCPVCTHITNEVSDFFAHWQYQLAMEENAQDGFASELGFCPMHTWQLLAMSSPQGASIGYAKLFEKIAENLKAAEHKNIHPNFIGNMVHNSKNCRVCELQRRVQNDYISKLAAFINIPDGRNLYQNSEGACLRHLDMLLNSVSSEESRLFLLMHASRGFEMDVEDMRSYVLKRDALRRNLIHSNQESAYRRSVIRFVGNKSVSMPWAEDGEI
jgi:predicted GTPase